MNCLIYPFAENHESLVNAINSRHQEIIVTEKVTPNGWAPSMKENGYEFTTDFDSSLKKVDGVIICDCRNFIWMKKDIISKIILSLKEKKKVFNCTELTAEELEEIERISDENGAEFVNYAVYKDVKKDMCEFIVDIDCPVVTIGNMMNRLDDYTALFELTSGFEKKGFKAVPIGSTFDAALIGGYVFPFNIFDERITEDDKIVMLNSYFNNVQLRTGANVIVLNLPEGLMKYTNDIVEGFGIRSLMASNAVCTDFFVLNVPFNQINTESVPQLYQHLEQKYNLSLDAICVDRKMSNFSDTLEMGTISYYPVKDSMIDKEVAVLNNNSRAIPVIRFNNRKAYTDIVERCVTKLS